MNSNHNNYYLSGNYAPVQDELTTPNLKVIGEIPKDLNGIYMRNGPNPAFPPIDYNFPFDGDGMIHAVYIEDGKAHYRNRYVETKALLKERKAGRALYGSILNPIPMDSQWKDAGDDPIALKNGAFIHVIRHAGRYLALEEAGHAYEITAKLETLGEWKPCGLQHPLEINAHTRLDPKTGNLWCIKYSIEPPYLSIYYLNSQGYLAKKWDIEKSHSTMIHDFVLTENYVIIFDCPIVLDIEKIINGGPVLNLQPELGVRIGIMSRHDGKMTWIETEAFFVFHFANAYENGQEIIIDYVRHEQLDFGFNQNKNEKSYPLLYRTIINLMTMEHKHIQLDERLVEFPRISEDRISLSHQFIYTPTKLNHSAEFNALIQYDVKNNSSQIHDFGKHAEIGEAVFASTKKQSEDEGYILLFVYDKKLNQSDLVILDAKNFENESLARIHMPRRIPHGLHGSWMPGKW